MGKEMFACARVCGGIVGRRGDEIKHLTGDFKVLLICLWNNPTTTRLLSAP